jgi:hypothetical protein
MVNRALGVGPLTVAVLSTLASGCKPEFADTDAIISAPRVVAVSATPAEAAPLVPVSFEALFVTPNGAGDPTDLSWAYCVARKPLTDEGTLAPECLAATSPDLVQLGNGQGAKGPLPAEACQLFGPDLPPPTPGFPTGRPVDPDASGGYFQPVRLLTPGASSTAVVGTTRLSCGLAGATADQSIEFNQRYRFNVNPAVDALRLRRGSEWMTVPADGGGEAGATVPAGATVTLEVGWAACPSGRACGDGVCDIDEDNVHCPKDCLVPRGCTGAERYLLFDPDSHTLVDRREAIRISWFATAGTFDVDRTDRAADDMTPSSTNTWTAPNGRGDVRLWVVLRDDRGGSGWQSYRVTVSD